MLQGLWTLSRGSVDDKLRWAFTLYDLDGDGQICRDEMTRVVTAVYELMGKFAEPWLKDGTTVSAHVDLVFQVSWLYIIHLSNYICIQPKPTQPNHIDCKFHKKKLKK